MSEIYPNHPMVQYLNSLRTQEEGANPTYVEENRRVFLDGLKEQFPWFPADAALRIETRLDRLVEAIVANVLPVDVVFLTGDAGDGKTAVCAKLAGLLKNDGDLQGQTIVGPWTIVKDASEIPERKLEDLVRVHLRSRNQGRKLLVAINEGRLRRLVYRARREQESNDPGGCAELASLWAPLIEPSLAAWIDEAAASDLDATMRTERVAVVNFRHRMHVREAVPRLLALWTDSSVWETSPACALCSARDGCPILANAVDLRDGIVQTRIADILTSAHFSGHRLPFRRLQAVLAITCTGGLHCSDVQTGGLAKNTGNSLDRLRYRFYEAIFYPSDVGLVAVRPEPVSRVFAPADPGTSATFASDQEIAALLTAGVDAAVLSPGGRPLGNLEHQAVAALRKRLHTPIASAKPRNDVVDELAQLTRNLRRLIALTSNIDVPPWRRALLLLESYAGHGVGDGEPLRHLAVAALNKLHRLSARNEEQIVSKQLDPAAFRNPVRLAIELDLGTEFETQLRKGPVLPALVDDWLEACASEIELEARPVGSSGEWARLRLDARLVEVLEGVADGYTLLTAFGPYRRDLARFHSHLLTLAAKKAPARLLLRVDERSYRVAAAPMGPKRRLRFEGQG